MSGHPKLLLATLSVCLLLSFGAQAAGQKTKSPTYRIRPSEVTVPPNVKVGEYMRTIRPFENWTLVCDEKLQERQKICNVTQIIEDRAGQVAFSWSLAATKEGKPYIILRAAPSAKPDGFISLKFNGRTRPVKIHIDGCNQAVCIGMLPVGPIMREEISKGATPTISYPTSDEGTISVTATLKGLSAAVAAIN